MGLEKIIPTNNVNLNNNGWGDSVPGSTTYNNNSYGTGNNSYGTGNNSYGSNNGW